MAVPYSSLLPERYAAAIVHMRQRKKEMHDLFLHKTGFIWINYTLRTSGTSFYQIFLPDVPT
jgi:hypothetical protein